MRYILFILAFALVINVNCSRKLPWDNPLDPVNDLPPNVPACISPPNDSLYIDNTVVLCWSCCFDQNQGDSVLYSIYVGTDDPPSTAVSIGRKDTTFTSTGLTPATRYYWKVEASDNHGNISYSTVRTFTTNSLHLVGAYNISGCNYHVIVRNNYAYVASESGVWTIDITDPSQPRYSGYWYNGVYVTVRAIALKDNYLYAGDKNGIAVIDISSPSNPSTLGNMLLAGDVSNMALKGDTLVSANLSGGLRIVDVSNHSYPNEIGSFSTWSVVDARDVSVAEGITFVADGAAGVRFINISDTTGPYEAGHFTTAGSAYGVKVSGPYAFVADRDYGLRILNVASLASPTEICHIVTPGLANGVSLHGQYAVIASSSSFTVFDISNPTMPFEKGRYYTTTPVYDVFIAGNYAYVANGYSGLKIIEILP